MRRDARSGWERRSENLLDVGKKRRREGEIRDERLGEMR